MQPILNHGKEINLLVGQTVHIVPSTKTVPVFGGVLEVLYDILTCLQYITCISCIFFLSVAFFFIIF